MRPVTAEQMRQIDRRAQEQFGLPGLILMEHAGTEVARVARHWLRRGRGVTLVLAGGGANGGDGFVAARHLDNWGFPVQMALLASPEKIPGSARTNLSILQRLSVLVEVLDSLDSWTRWARRRHSFRLVIDALLGTGASGQVREPIRSAIVWLNRQPCPVISVDLPSGLCADTGKPSPVAVKATVTVTCGLPKIGLRKGQGPRWCGRVTVADISLPRVLRTSPVTSGGG